MTVIGVIACAGCAAQRPADDEERFFGLSFGYQRSAMLAMDDAAKLRLFELAMRRQHPPNLSLISSLVASGARIAPGIASAAESTDTDVAVMGFAGAIAILAERGELAPADTALVHRMMARVQRLDPGRSRREAEKQLSAALAALRDPSAPGPPP